mmetsp:Transcript_9783/g.22854  ORF Transcript_9783/g.22854 Transcript_9783/m.22854 type:complete len:80 (+) Transcript_9783:406-645(+)
MHGSCCWWLFAYWEGACTGTEALLARFACGVHTPSLEGWLWCWCVGAQWEWMRLLDRPVCRPVHPNRFCALFPDAVCVS